MGLGRLMGWLGGDGLGKGARHTLLQAGCHSSLSAHRHTKVKTLYLPVSVCLLGRSYNKYQQQNIMVSDQHSCQAVIIRHHSTLV